MAIVGLHDVRNRIKIAWQKWRELTCVLCDNKMSIQIKGKVYKSIIRPVMMYGAEAWTLTRKEEELLERPEMRMLRWILGVSLRDRRRNKDIREVLGVAYMYITDKVREARMRWYGCCIKRIMNAEVYGRRSRGRQKKRWRNKIQEDLNTLKLKKEDAEDRNKWRRRIRVAETSPRRD